MGITIVWDNDEKTVIRYDFDKHWNWEDFFAAKEEAFTRIDGVGHKVGVIMNAPPDVSLPPNWLTHTQSALKNRHPNTEVIIVVVSKLFQRTMINTLIKLARKDGRRLQIVDSLESARKMVADRLGKLQVAGTA